MYVCYAFVYCDNENPQVRMMLAIILKDNVSRYWKTLSAEVQQYIMVNGPVMLSHPEMLLRELCSGLITVILAQTKFAGWPDILDNLIAAMDSDNPNLVAGTMATLDKICEDHGRELCQIHPELAQQPIALLIPKLLTLIESDKEEAVNNSLKCIIHLIPWKPSKLLLEIKRFLQVRLQSSPLLNFNPSLHNMLRHTYY
jgi:transportin-1